MAAARTEDERVDAEKALEVAAIYEIYKRNCRLPTPSISATSSCSRLACLKDHADVRAHVHDRFKHILVDEYQDVNLASARLLRAIRGTGTDVWVVADQRQSIYRFRGASLPTLRASSDEFGGNRRALDTNYRSVAQVVRTFETFLRHHGRRRRGGTVGGDRADAGDVIAGRGANSGGRSREPSANASTRFKRRGVPYREQVILARRTSLSRA